jgi:hypothetical protein
VRGDAAAESMPVGSARTGKAESDLSAMAGAASAYDSRKWCVTSLRAKREAKATSRNVA